MLFLIWISLLLPSAASLQIYPLKMSSHRVIRSVANVSPNEVVTPKLQPTISIWIGTPGQLVEMAIDTTSGDTWIVDVNAVQPHPSSNEFWPTLSSSLKKSTVPISSQVPDLNGHIGGISGFIAEDVITPDHSSNEASGNFSLSFALINKIAANDPALSLDLPAPTTSGVFGLGFHSSDGLTTFLDQFLKIESPANQAFSVVLIQCMSNKWQTNTMGEFVVGGMDTRYCNPGTEVIHSLVDNQNWNIKMQGFFVDAHGLGGLNQINMTFDSIVTFDTTQLLTGVPPDVYKNIVEITSAKMDPEYQWPVVDCSVEYPDLHFNFGGNIVSVTERMYIYREFTNYQTPCHLMVYPLEHGGGYLPSWSFGYLMNYEKCMLYHHGENYISFSDYNRDICNTN